jgi:hypothetical protein
MRKVGYTITSKKLWVYPFPKNENAANSNLIKKNPYYYMKRVYLRLYTVSVHIFIYSKEIE